MNNISNNPVWGPWREDAAAWQIVGGPSTDDELAGTTFIPHGDLTNIPDAGGLLMEALSNKNKNMMMTTNFQFSELMGTEHQLPVLAGSTQISGNPQANPIPQAEQVVEETIANFNHKYYDKYEFEVVESECIKNKPYEVNGNLIIAKPGKGIKINVLGAKSGQTVEMSMRFKDDEHLRKPVLSCRKHNVDKNPNTYGSFYVVSKNNETENEVQYETKDGHHTAIMTIPNLLMEPFSFSPIFRCWNFCNASICREQKMIFRLCDQMTGQVLHSKSFDIRVCENVGRDYRDIQKEKKGVKRLKTSTSKKVRHQKIKNELELQEGAMALNPSTSLMATPLCVTSKYYMVELDDNLLPILEALVKVSGKQLVQIDPTSVRVIN